MLVDRVELLADAVIALRGLVGQLGEPMYYDNDHRYADASDTLNEAFNALLLAEVKLQSVADQMKETDLND